MAVDIVTGNYRVTKEDFVGRKWPNEWAVIYIPTGEILGYCSLLQDTAKIVQSHKQQISKDNNF